MAILLIRHGETESNANRIIQTPETPLSARGLEQADRLAALLAALGVETILSSDLARAFMTAERIAEATGAPIVRDVGLQERNFGALRGRAYADLDLDLFDEDYAPPEGETWDQFRERVAGAWDRVSQAGAEAQGHLAVVTHGLLCYTVAARHVTVPDGWEIPLRWENASLTIIEAKPPWMVRLLNDNAHLDGARRGDATGLPIV